MSLAIRPAETRDLEALIALYRQLNPADPPLDPERATEVFRHMLRHPGLSILCGFVGEKLVASCTLIVIPNLTRAAAPYALIENVVTDAECRRSGYGRAMMRDAIDRAFAEGCYKVMLLTGRSDPGISGFYESCGFLQNKTGFQIRSQA